MFKTEILFLDWSDTCRYKFLLTCDSFPDPVKTRTNGLMDFGVGRERSRSLRPSPLVWPASCYGNCD